MIISWLSGADVTMMSPGTGTHVMSCHVMSRHVMSAHLALVLARVPGLHPGDPQAPLAAVLTMEDAEPGDEQSGIMTIITRLYCVHSLHSQQRLVINEKRKEFLMKASYQWEFL